VQAQIKEGNSMNAMHVMTDWFCQVDIHFNYKKHLIKWITILDYFFTLEDSRDTVYREPVSAHPEYLNKRIEKAKAVFWIGMGIAFALLLSQLQ
jgi:hypothetical protein